MWTGARGGDMGHKALSRTCVAAASPPCAPSPGPNRGAPRLGLYRRGKGTKRGGTHRSEQSQVLIHDILESAATQRVRAADLLDESTAHGIRRHVVVRIQPIHRVTHLPRPIATRGAFTSAVRGWARLLWGSMRRCVTTNLRAQETHSSTDGRRDRWTARQLCSVQAQEGQSGRAERILSREQPPTHQHYESCRGRQRSQPVRHLGS